MKNQNEICLFAEYPIPGKVKNRLEDLIGKKQSAFLARAFLMDMISTSLRVPKCSVNILYSPAECRGDFEDILHLFSIEEKDKQIARKSGSIELTPQADGDLGLKLSEASRSCFERGANKVIFVGSESPLLQPVVLRASFRLLNENQIVIGPTFNGGFYLLGCNGHYPEMFAGIDWARISVYKDAVNRLSSNGLKWLELELSYDVNGPDELEQLYFDIDNLRLTGENNIAYHTEKCLQNLEK